MKNYSFIFYKVYLIIFLCLIYNNAYSQGLSITNGQQFYDLDIEKGVQEKNVKVFVDKKDRFHIFNRSQRIHFRTIDYRINESEDYSIEAEVSHMISSSTKICGIIFGALNWDNCWEFLFCTEVITNVYAPIEPSKYRVLRRINGMEVYDSGWKPLGYKTNNCKLKIWKMDQKLLFAIDGKLVNTVDAPKLAGSQHGFLVYGGDYALHNFYIKEFPSEYSNGASNQASSSNSSSANANGGGPKIVGSGTGFVIDSRGYLVTNYHVTSDANALYVCLQNNGEWNSYYAKVIKNDPVNDLSIIKIEDPNFREFSNLPYAISFDAEDIASDIFTLGYPQVLVMGTDVKYTTGVINAKTGVQGDPTHYQISAHIDHGSSGGPLFNSDGYIIGITDSGLDKATYGDVNYAIKSTYLKALADALPIKLYLPNDKSISEKKRTEQIKDLSPYVALILIAQ